MPEAMQSLRLDQPATYQIIVQGRLDVSWADWFGGMQIHTQKEARGGIFTVISGRVRDQAELHGMLDRMRDLCLPLIRVRLMHPIPDPPGEE